MRFHEISPLETTRIDELFDRQLPFEWQTKHEKYWRALMQVDGEEYSITATREEYFELNDTPVEYWELSFGLTSDGFSGSKVVGTNGNEFLIFSTVFQAFKEFLIAVTPEHFGISAVKKNENRFPLYQHLVARLKPKITQLGYRESECPVYNDKSINLNKYYDSICFSVVS